MEKNIIEDPKSFIGYYDDIEESFTTMTGAISTLEGYFEQFGKDENVKQIKRVLDNCNYKVNIITEKVTGLLSSHPIKYDRRKIDRVIRHVNLLKPRLWELELYVMAPYNQMAELEYRILKRQHEVWSSNAPKDLVELRNSVFKVCSSVHDKLTMNPVVMNLNELYERLDDAEFEEIKKLSLFIEGKYEFNEQLDERFYDMIDSYAAMILRRISSVDGDYSTSQIVNPFGY